jgi:hypothetical protein
MYGEFQHSLCWNKGLVGVMSIVIDFLTGIKKYNNDVEAKQIGGRIIRT